MSAATELARWIEREHPDLFAQLYAAAIASGVNTRPVRLRGFGDDGVTDIPFDASTFAQPSVSIDTSADTGGSSFWSSLGSGITDAASAVGNWVTSTQGLTSLTNLASSYFKAQQTNSQAQLQQQVLQSQVAAARAGASPAPITYVTGSNGQPVPVYQTATAVPLMPASGLQRTVPAVLPPVLQAAVQNGSAQLIPLSDGSTGYTLTPSLTQQLTSGSLFSNPWFLAAAVLGAVALLA